MTKKINKSPTAEIKQIPKNVKRGKTKIKTIIDKKKCLKDTRATRGSVKFTCHRLKRWPKRNRKGCWRQLKLIGIARNLDAIQLGSYKAQLWTHCFHGSLDEWPICSHDCLWAHCQSSYRCCNSCSHFWGDSWYSVSLSLSSTLLWFLNILLCCKKLSALLLLLFYWEDNVSHLWVFCLGTATLFSGLWFCKQGIYNSDFNYWWMWYRPSSIFW